VELRGAHYPYASLLLVDAADCRVDGASMQPCLNPAQSPSADWVLVEKLTVKGLRHYTRGEVVVLW
jgi:signal peptidase I